MWAQEVYGARSLDRGHGRLEVRRLEATERLAAYLDWPRARAVCRIRRERTVAGQCSSETVYAITSLERRRAGAKRLLTISRQHWGIENRLHWVRDVSMQEDRCRVRSGPAAQALAALRNTALTLLRRLGYQNISAALEHCAEHRQNVIHLLRYGIIE
jgi:predicted transposase YbfD/YdcC